MKKFMLVPVLAIGCATAPQKSEPQIQTVTVEKTVIVEVTPADLWDCEPAKAKSPEALKVCKDHNEREQIRHERDLLLAEKKAKKPAPAPKPEPKRKRGGGGGGVPVMMAGMPRPGGSVDAYNRAQALMRPMDATKCGGFVNGFEIRNLERAEKFGANTVVAYLPRTGMFVNVTGCLIQAERTVLSDLDGNGAFDMPYGAGNLIGHLNVPLQIGERVQLFFLTCGLDQVCQFRQSREYQRGVNRNWTVTDGGVQLKRSVS